MLIWYFAYRAALVNKNVTAARNAVAKYVRVNK
jgi:hypothetical protein